LGLWQKARLTLGIAPTAKSTGSLLAKNKA